ncbi:hypothetical protein RI129_001057 [Pyrocoelia pectoralis]|uniref:Ubiquitin thioesterase OTU n=1 Tax=Pyrocoelia pectoralis TaxID=417401 RepID=A0AAN7VUH4_9COLE
MTGFALKIKTKTGQHVVRTLNCDSTVGNLKSELLTLQNIPINRLQILSGFPPKAFDLTSDTTLLSELGIKSGDTLIVEEKPIAPETPVRLHPVSTEQGRHHVSENQVGCHGILMKKIVPADNSCLFTSIHFVLNGKVENSENVAPLMRQMIAEAISKDPENFSEAILGKPNQEYCNWILNDTTWGGGIEIAILSNHFGIEIDVVDTTNAVINRFGEDRDYAHRVLLLFDGIHYDPLYLESLEGNVIQTIFPVDDDKILREAEQIAQEAKSSRQFTDVNKFTVKCLVCNILISGQGEVQQHAKSTGHMNFGEV